MRLLLSIFACCLISTGLLADEKLYVIVRQSTWSNIVDAAESKFQQYATTPSAKMFSMKWALEHKTTGDTWGYTLFSGGAFALKKSGNPITDGKIATYYGKLPAGIRNNLRMGFGTKAEIMQVVKDLGLKKKPVEPI